MSKKLAIQIIDENPLAADILRQWYLEKMKKSFVDDSVPEDFKNMMLKKGIPDQTLAILLDESPRSFFDVLDAYHIYIETYIYRTEDGPVFSYSVNDKISDEDYKDRISCDRDAVTEALENLK